MAPRETQTKAISAQIKAGYVLHIDPDYLLLTYGERVVAGPLSPGVIGPRYALCIGVEGEVTFWSLLTSQNSIHSQEIPEAAKQGSWAGNGRPSYLAKTQVWMATREMILEAHMQVNTVKSSFRHSYATVSMISPWPAIPPTFPKEFPAVNRIRPEDRTVLEAPPAPELPDYIPGIFSWGTWMQEHRKDLGVSLHALAAVLNLPSLDADTLGEVEAERRQMSVHELATWAKCMGLLGDIHLRQIPTQEDAPVGEVQALNAAEEVVESTPAGNLPLRTTITDKALKLLTNARLTDEEAHQLVQRLEQAAIGILLGA